MAILLLRKIQFWIWCDLTLQDAIASAHAASQTFSDFTAEDLGMLGVVRRPEKAFADLVLPEPWDSEKGD